MAHLQTCCILYWYWRERIMTAEQSSVQSKFKTSSPKKNKISKTKFTQSFFVFFKHRFWGGVGKPLKVTCIRNIQRRAWFPLLTNDYKNLSVNGYSIRSGYYHWTDRKARLKFISLSPLCLFLSILSFSWGWDNSGLALPWGWSSLLSGRTRIRNALLRSWRIYRL